MEKRIELTTSTNFELSHEETERLYTTLALFQYQYERTPDYNEVALRRRLCNDFQRFNTELIKMCESDPNNLRLSQIYNFFQRHYGSLKKTVKQDKR